MIENIFVKYKMYEVTYAVKIKLIDDLEVEV